ATKFRLFICCGAALVILGLAWAGSGWGGVPTGNRTPLILAFGDSLTSGFGLPVEDSFPEQLERALRARGVHARVESGGAFAATTAGGLQRLDWSLADKPDLVILE